MAKVGNANNVVYRSSLKQSGRRQDEGLIVCWHKIGSGMKMLYLPEYYRYYHCRIHTHSHSTMYPQSYVLLIAHRS